MNCLRLFFTCIFQQVGGTFQSWPLDMTPKEFCENYDRAGNIIFKFRKFREIKLFIIDFHFHYPSIWAFKNHKIKIWDLYNFLPNQRKVFFSNLGYCKTFKWAHICNLKFRTWHRTLGSISRRPLISYWHANNACRHNYEGFHGVQTFWFQAQWPKYKYCPNSWFEEFW